METNGVTLFNKSFTILFPFHPIILPRFIFKYFNLFLFNGILKRNMKEITQLK